MRPHELLPALFGALGMTALALVGLPSSTLHTLVTSGPSLILDWSRHRCISVWLLPCLLAVAVVAGSRLLRRPAVRQVLLISSPALVAVALAVF